MTLMLEDKKAIVASVREVANQSFSILIAEYRGATVDKMTALRAKARAVGVDCRVVRNTLARIALKGTEFECVIDALVGPSILAFATKEPSAAARLFRDFLKDYEAITVKKLAIQGQAYGPEQLKAIAELPTREEALATILGVMQAPVSKFVRTAAEPTAKFARLLAALRDQRASAT